MCSNIIHRIIVHKNVRITLGMKILYTVKFEFQTFMLKHIAKDTLDINIL